ncbi:alpha/beta fold hydrolase [Amycolatopsis magusensis]|uniref:Pimeloyl-ACP methyl ester carboxylesterase n=1 Tax=Amycolatopsis magusensis TaxID=882444 RepID=A0ABS4PW27_9PSEU|nr:alpha/beta hydrolase [Amycolatopsis magusensis]MBP2183627.1 pimeloyl-ACP methyl ester carboxylesterase [Amycolatopsis magusensis]
MTESSPKGAEPRHRMVSAGDLRWHIVEAGEGPTVVLAAGFPQSVYAWRRVVPLLAGNHHVIAVDLPGQGDSDKPVGGYDTWTTAERLHDLLARLGEDRYVLVGHDVGAWVGYPFAHRYPERLRGLVLLDGNIPGVTLRPTITLGPDNWRNWHFLFNPIPDLPEALLSGRERVLIEWFFSRKTANWRETFTREDIDEYERAYATHGGLRGMLGYYRAVLEDIERNTTLMHQQITVPVLALGGEVGSAPDLYESMKPLAADVRGGVIAGSGHYIPEEKPAELVAEIARFSADLPA